MGAHSTTDTMHYEPIIYSARYRSMPMRHCCYLIQNHRGPAPSAPCLAALSSAAAAAAAAAAAWCAAAPCALLLLRSHRRCRCRYHIHYCCLVPDPMH